MKKLRDQDIQKIKLSIFTEQDLIWLKKQIKKLTDFLLIKNKCRQREALELFFAIEKITAAKLTLELRVYTVLAEIQHYFRAACGTSHRFWTLFYRDMCDQKIAQMEKNKDHHTFARGLATILQTVGEAVPNLTVTRISDTGKKELTATLNVLDPIMPSTQEILAAEQSL